MTRRNLWLTLGAASVSAGLLAVYLWFAQLRLETVNTIEGIGKPGEQIFSFSCSRR